jgi:catechol-2,3-dioxygenase
LKEVAGFFLSVLSFLSLLSIQKLKTMKNVFLHAVITFMLILGGIAHGQTHSKYENMEQENKNGGIVFLATQDLEKVADFYKNKVGCEMWLDQGACKILKHGNMLFGFCNSDHVDKEGVITFFYPAKEKVDVMYSKLQDIAEDKPKMNPKFRIYHFYAKDPEGRSIEFQYFDHELKDY